jgi:hypothetical protein
MALPRHAVIGNSGQLTTQERLFSPTFDDKTAFGFLGDQLARALFTKEWSAMLGL